LLDYAQESGRAGRDGLRSEAVIIQPVGVNPPNWEADGLEHREAERVQQYMDPGDNSCRRFILDRYLDGTVDGYTRNRCGDLDAPGAEEQRCDGCEPDWPAYEIEGSGSDISDKSTASTPEPMEDIQFSHSRVTNWIAGNPDPPDPARPDPANPDPTNSDPARTYPARSYPARPDPANPDPTNSDPARTYPARTYPARSYPARPDPANPDPTNSDPARSYPARPDPANPDPTNSDPARTYPARTYPARTYPANRNPARPDPVNRLAISQIVNPPETSIQPIFTPDNQTTSSDSDYNSETLRSQVGSISPIHRQELGSANRREAQYSNRQERGSTNQHTQPNIPPQAIQQFQQQDRQRQGARWEFEQAQQAIAGSLEFLQAQVHLWRDRCWYCTQHGFNSEHDLYQCPYGNDTGAKAWFLHVRRNIIYARFSGCYQCGLPQTICERWKYKGSCIYRGVMISMVAMMVHGDRTEGIRQAWQRRLQAFGVDIEDRTAVVGFLGQRHGAEEVNELVQEFLWLRKTWIEVGEIS